MKKYSLLISAVILAFSACKPVTAVYESEKTKGVDFSKYKTYAWRATKDTAYTKLVSKQKVERALASEVIKELTLTLDNSRIMCITRKYMRQFGRARTISTIMFRTMGLLVIVAG